MHQYLYFMEIIMGIQLQFSTKGKEMCSDTIYIDIMNKYKIIAMF